MNTTSLPDLPRRGQLAAAVVRVIKIAGPTKADLLLIDAGQGPMVVKDFANKVWWVRLAGRIQIHRECKAYRWLGPMSGIPALIGRIDRYALALEWIDGRQIAMTDERLRRGPALFPRLKEIVAELHRRGLTHFDLRGRENVIVTDDDEVYVLDFAGAFCLKPGGLRHRLFFRWMKLVDDSALLKWKLMLNAGPYTEVEQQFLDRYRFWRSLWVFNRKRRQAIPKNG